MENLISDSNDDKLLGFCMDRRRTIGEIAKALAITPASVSIKVKKLYNAGLVSIDKRGKGRKTFVRAKEGDKTRGYLVQLLQELKSRKDAVSEDEYLSLLPFKFGVDSPDKFSAPLKLLHIRPKLVERKIAITEEGKKFLKENQKLLKK